MFVFLMVIAFLGSDGGQIQAHQLDSLAACEAAKPEVTKQALAAKITDLGMTCVQVSVGKIA